MTNPLQLRDALRAALLTTTAAAPDPQPTLVSFDNWQFDTGAGVQASVTITPLQATYTILGAGLIAQAPYPNQPPPYGFVICEALVQPLLKAGGLVSLFTGTNLSALPPFPVTALQLVAFAQVATGLGQPMQTQTAVFHSR